MNVINLHIHTDASDGIHDYKKVISTCKDKELKIISITDHDNVERIKEALVFAKSKSIILIPGVELTTDYQSGTCHILGYNIDIDKINTFNQYIKKNRIIKAKKIINEIYSLGYNISYEEVLKHSTNDIISKHDIAKYMVLKGYFDTEENTIKNIFNNEKIKKIKTKAKTIEECINAIKESNGIAILAHPWTLGLNNIELETFILKYKLDGIEIYNHNIDNKEYLKLNNLANKLKLYKTCGTDYHGKKEYTELIVKKNINCNKIIKKLITGDEYDKFTKNNKKTQY